MDESATKLQTAGPLSAGVDRDYDIVRGYLLELGAPFYDFRSKKRVNDTPIVEITKDLSNLIKRKSNQRELRFFLKEEYRNRFSESVKGRAVASLVLSSLQSGAIYRADGTKKKWIEPTSGNTGKGLASIARLLGVDFTAVFSRLDVSQVIRKAIEQVGGSVLTIGSEYSIEDLAVIGKNLHRKIIFYWAMLSPLDANTQTKILERIKLPSDNGRSREEGEIDNSIREIDGHFLIDPLLPLALASTKSPILSKNLESERADQKTMIKKMIPELDDPNYIVVFLCNHGNSSMAVNTFLNQLGFSNVGSLKEGVEKIRELTGSSNISSDEFCPVPGSSIARSSIDFVRKVILDHNDEFFSFMQYENIENPEAHEKTTGPELSRQLPNLKAVVCTFGTGGTATGLAQFFKETSVRVVVAFPQSPVEGIRTMKGADGLAFYRPDLYDKIIEVGKSESDLVLSHLLQRKIRVGPSTAVAVAAALHAEVVAMNGSGDVAIIAADAAENYNPS